MVSLGVCHGIRSVGETKTDSQRCRALCSVECFHILDHASTSLQLKIKEAIHIQREQPSLNQQLHHVNLKLSF